jgi:hypothetical protein
VNKRYTTLNARSASLLAASVTFISGFGSLALLWIVQQKPLIASHGGYRTAIVGDAVLLPLIVGILTRCVLSSPFRRRDHFLMVAGGVIGGVAGFLVQYGILADPSPARQWLLSSPHHFSLPGWWHAVFFVMTSVFIAALWLLTLARLHRNQHFLLEHKPREQQRATAWLAFAVGGFLGLNVVDAGSNVEHSSTQVVLLAVSVVAAAVVGLLFAAAPKWTFSERNAILGGVAMSALLAVASRKWPPSAAGLAGIGLVFVAQAIMTHVLSSRKGVG